MDSIKIFEQFDKKVKELEREKIRAEEQYARAKKDTENSLKELLDITNTKSINEAVDYMKTIKAELDTLKEQLDQEIKIFNDRLKELGD